MEEISIEQLEQIEGLNVEEGMQNCIDDLEIYTESLYGYVYEDNRLDKLVELFNLSDWKNYCIEIHALKSASYLVGAKELGDISKSLEFACKEDNIEFVKNNHANAISMYENLLNSLKNVIGE